MELVTRQSEQSGHQQRLLQVFTEDVFIFSYIRVHSALELSGRCALQIYLLTYLLEVALLVPAKRLVAKIVFKMTCNK